MPATPNASSVQGLPEPLLPSWTGLFQDIPWAPFCELHLSVQCQGCWHVTDRQEKAAVIFWQRYDFDSCQGKLKTFFLSGLFHPVSAATGFLARTEVLWTAVLLWDESFHDARRTKRVLYRAWPLWKANQQRNGSRGIPEVSKVPLPPQLVVNFASEVLVMLRGLAPNNTRTRTISSPHGAGRLRQSLQQPVKNALFWETQSNHCEPRGAPISWPCEYFFLGDFQGFGSQSFDLLL